MRKVEVRLNGPIETQLRIYYEEINSRPRIAAKLMTRKNFLIVKSDQIVVKQDFEPKVVLKRLKYLIKDSAASPKGDCNNNPVAEKCFLNVSQENCRKVGEKYESYKLGRDNSLQLQADSPELPRGIIPVWAEQSPLLRSLRWTKKISPEVIFAPPDSPDLDAMFPSTQSSRNIWNSPSK